jgi:two-component system phosphate regulon sensor histidine kinase PhoR
MPSQIEPLADALPVPVLVIGPTERIVLANDPARRLLPTGVVGRHYITALRQPSVLDAVEGVLSDGRRRQTAYLGGEPGRESVWRVSAAAITLDEGRGCALTFEDVTAVEEAGRIRRDFVANVSHELRTPLTALLGFIETLRGPARDDADARDRFLAIMEREANRMVRLVQDLLSLRQVEDAERQRPTDPVALAPLMESVALALEPVAKAQGVTLRLEGPDTPVIVPGDAGQLRQVLTNLIENAIKYGGSGGAVDLRLSLPSQETMLRGDGVRLSVTDHGEGIAAHHIPRLTERFYRVDSHRSREVGGTGLGLAIVKHIVNRHRGRLRIDSKPGQGTTFTVILPADLPTDSAAEGRPG